MTITNDGLRADEDVWRKSDPASSEPVSAGDDETEPPELPGLLPEEFWNARNTFMHIRDAAWAEGRSGDPVFYATVTRFSGMIDRRIKMRTGIMGRGSLNLYSAIVGDPGAGKSTSADAAPELIPSKNPEFRDGMPLGSGEGIAEIYMGWVEEYTGKLIENGKNKGQPETARIRRQVRHNAYFYVDEGERLTQLAGRQGQVLIDTLRSAAMGSVLGQTNASEDRNRYVGKGTYSLGLVIGYQPTTVRQLLADGGGGTPQRFFWSWAYDPALPFDAPVNPGPLSIDPSIEDSGRDIDITFPPDVMALMRRERVQHGRNELQAGALDGHYRFMTAKMAALLALLEGRFVVNDEDWRLAEMIWDASCAVRDSLAARAKRETQAVKDLEAKEKIQLEVLTHKAKRGAENRAMRVAAGVARAVADAGPGGLTYNGVRMKLASRDRDVLEEAIDIAVSKGWTAEDGDQYVVGPEYAKRS